MTNEPLAYMENEAAVREEDGPEPADLLRNPAFRARFEETAAALEVADVVRQMRRRALSRSGTAGISQAELAMRTGISQPRISQIENCTGRDGISYALLRRIANACGLDLGAALRGAITGGSAFASEPLRTSTQEAALPVRQAPLVGEPAEPEVLLDDGTQVILL